MSGGLDLKVTGPDGTLHLTQQLTSITLGQLADQIEQKFSISRSQMAISFGYPPKVLKGELDTTLLSLGVANRERMRVKRTDTDLSFSPQALKEAENDGGSKKEADNDAGPTTPPAQPADAASQFAEVTSLSLDIAKLWCDIIGGGDAEVALSAYFANPNALQDLGVHVKNPFTATTPVCETGGASSMAVSEANKSDGIEVMVLRRIESDNSCLFNAIG